MKSKTEKDEKICWACKRILVGGSKFVLCPNCLNKYGSTAAALGIGVMVFLSKKVLKNGGKIAKGAIDVIKNIKS